MREERNMKKAFTLIELLVVIAIIAILAAILFPVFAQAKQAAKLSADLSNTKQLGIGVVLYIADTDDVYPQGYWYKNNSGEVNGYVDLSAMINPYVKSQELWKSPADANGGLDPRWPSCENISDFTPSPAGNACDNQVKKRSFTANAALIPRKRRTIDPANVVSATAVDQVAGTIILAPFSDFKSCVYDDSVQQNTAIVNKSHRPTNAVMLQSGEKWSGDSQDAAVFGAPLYAVTVAVAQNAFDICKTQESSALPHIKYINPKRGANGSNYAFADGHSKNITFSATVNPENFMWGKQMYSAGARAIFDANGLQVR